MKQELKDKWIAALRSGDYKQGVGELRQVKEDGCTYHCCLGVLAEVADLEIRGLGVVVEDGDNSYAPLQKLIDEDSNRREYLSTEYFYRLNDRDRLSFNEIADKIEKEL